MKKLHYLLFILLFCSVSAVQAQIVSGETPPSFIQTIQTPKVIAEEMLSVAKSIKAPNIDSLKKEDAITDNYKDIPFRFGTLTSVNYTLNNAGTWVHYEDGTSKYQLIIKTKEALSINLNFSQFFLSKGAKLFVFNQEKTDVLGAITSKNNKKDSLFSIRPILGNSILLELYLPSNEISNNRMDVNGVVYGYRSLFEKGNKAFGSSGNCEIDINCPEGDKWQDIKRSVVMILTSGNTRKCTGTLVNNTALDSIPYILTAEHCNTTNSSVFVFNYESPLCQPNRDGLISQSISGASFRATSNLGGSDFTLFELSSKPPAAYGVYYAGWSAINPPAINGTTIHHPKGDVKKISYSNDSIFESSYNDVLGEPKNHWKVKNWEKGSTEEGSSGSPLFDENQRLIGQLHGGSADCGLKLSDYYGKFSVSWDNQTQFNRQLKHWLDPINSNKKILDGLDTKVALNTNDIKIIGIHSLKRYYCATPKSFIYTLSNKGLDTIFTAQFKITTNNSLLQTINWSDTIPPMGIEKIKVNAPVLQNGNNLLKVYVDSINGGTDANNNNDTAKFELFFNANPKMATLTLKTDDYGSETTWEVISSNGTIIAVGGNYKDITGGKTYTIPLCLYASCFTFNLFDLAGDGFNGMYGSGYAKITWDSKVLLNESNFTAAKKSIPFCLDTTTGLWETSIKENQDIHIFPNPLNSFESLTIQIKKESNITQAEVFNMDGRKLTSFQLENEKESILLKNQYPAGMYVLVFKNKKGDNISRKRLVILK